ncbi:MAG: hypothetical protein ACOC34_03840 [Thermotogota bacterium]
MNFAALIKKMNHYTHSAMFVHDLALSASKLMKWNEEGWNRAPRLTTGANREDLSRKILPFCLEMSDNMKIFVNGMLRGETIDNGTKLGSFDDFVSSEEIVAVQIVLFNYCLLEEYEFGLVRSHMAEHIADISDAKFSLKDIYARGIDVLKEGVVERKFAIYSRKGVTNRVKDWCKFGCEELREDELKKYEILSTVRNQLTHESSAPPPSVRESLGLFHAMRVVAKGIARSFGDNSVDKVDVPWNKLNVELSTT